MYAHNGDLRAQNGALEGLKTRGRRFQSLRTGAGSGSAIKWNSGSGSALKWCGSAIMLERNQVYNTGSPDLHLHATRLYCKVGPLVLPAWWARAGRQSACVATRPSRGGGDSCRCPSPPGSIPLTNGSGSPPLTVGRPLSLTCMMGPSRSAKCLCSDSSFSWRRR